MRKLLALFAFICVVQATVHAQTTLPAAERLRLANDETKTLLVSKLNLSSDAASAVLLIENEFFKRMADIKALQSLSVKEREIKLNEAHVTRRDGLQNIPLTPRQMEDVVALSEQIRRKHKL